MMKMENKKVLVIGSGAITIGQGAEFDYSGTQACQVLKDYGYQVILMNPNPATIMTDKTIADVIYSEPLTLEMAEKIIIKEAPQYLIAGMGGQTALNLALKLDEAGVLKTNGVQIIGTASASIKTSEDRALFKKAMEDIHQPVLASKTAHSVDEATEIANEIGLPVVVRPAFTLGGTGGGIAETEKELKTIVENGLKLSIANQVLIEKSIKGWKEIEYEMMRDAKGNAIAVCNMENMNPIGVHTGDSIVVAPSQTLCDKEYQMLRQASIEIVNALDIIGGCNVQLALHPTSQAYYIIEVNPRVSRSSALASKATGYPIAKVATYIALGKSLDEIDNGITGKTKACFEPTLDYCVVKMPKWPFDLFDDASSQLGTTMMATGEVMAIANNFESALLKAVRSLERSEEGLLSKDAQALTLKELLEKVTVADDQQLFYMSELFRRQVGLAKLHGMTQIDTFFLEKIKVIIELENDIRNRLLENISCDQLKTLKKKGFTDAYISALLLKTSDKEVYDYRKRSAIMPVYKMVDTCGGEFEAKSPYYYSTYDTEDEVEVSSDKKVIVIGSGPIRIGQGIEFDYCSVHSVLALKKMGIEAIMVNNNPETVSTDYDVADKLYFEPLTGEDVMHIIEKEKPMGVLLQFGGQSAIKLAAYLEDCGVNILGTTKQHIHETEDRDCFNKIMASLGIEQPKGTGVISVEEGLNFAEMTVYPLLVRPSFVIGGFGMAIVEDKEDLVTYLEKAFTKTPSYPVLLDQYIEGIEVEVDAICDGDQILIPGIMEHIDEAGIHSGDSIAVYPPKSLTDTVKNKIAEMTEIIGKGLKIHGIFNIQFIVSEEKVYVIEVNPRASRTTPFISKVTDIPMIEIATRVCLGQGLDSQAYASGLVKDKDFYAVKYPVFSMEKIKETEIALGPVMKSTGEVMGVGKTFNQALQKGLMAAKGAYSQEGTIIVSLSDGHKASGCSAIKQLINLGYELLLTPGTYEKMLVTHPHVKGYQMITHESIDQVVAEKSVMWIVNLPTSGKNKKTSGFKLRRLATEQNIHCITSMNAFMNLTSMLIKSRELEADVYSMGWYLNQNLYM